MLKKLLSNSGQVISKEQPIKVDFHSHLIPDIDDGVSTLDESISIIRGFAKLGYKKIITTPHINAELFDNNPQIINNGLKDLKKAINEHVIDIEIAAAAEYYMDERFYEQVENGEEFLTLHDQYILVETSMLNQPAFLLDVLFKLKSNGYQPILAHPERYLYLQNNFDMVEKLKNQNILFQVNINSIGLVYTRSSKDLIKKILDHNYAEFICSDCHHTRHFQEFRKNLAHFHKKYPDYVVHNNHLL